MPSLLPDTRAPRLAGLARVPGEATGFGVRFLTILLDGGAPPDPEPT